MTILRDKVIVKIYKDQLISYLAAKGGGGEIKEKEICFQLQSEN